MVPSTSAYKRRHGSRGNPGQRGARTACSGKGTADEFITINMTIFIFRGQPDVYYKRHVLMYFTTPDDGTFYETVHVQRDDESKPWKVDRLHGEVNWALTKNYIGHMYVGAVQVRRSQKMAPVDIVASVPVAPRLDESDWNCQRFLLEGLQAFVSHGLQTQEWYSRVEDELTSHLLEGTVA